VLDRIWWHPGATAAVGKGCGDDRVHSTLNINGAYYYNQRLDQRRRFMSGYERIRGQKVRDGESGGGKEKGGTVGRKPLTLYICSFLALFYIHSTDNNRGAIHGNSGILLPFQSKGTTSRSKLVTESRHPTSTQAGQ